MVDWVAKMVSTTRDFARLIIVIILIAIAVLTFSRRRELFTTDPYLTGIGVENVGAVPSVPLFANRIVDGDVHLPMSRTPQCTPPFRGTGSSPAPCGGLYPPAFLPELSQW